MDLEPLSAGDERELRLMLERHAEYTGSRVAAALVAGWSQAVASFVKVMPRDYKRALRAAEEAVAAVSREQVALG